MSRQSTIRKARHCVACGTTGAAATALTSASSL